jgi:1-acyl-sn-glycerol-3-phosphate acyltransferase
MTQSFGAFNDNVFKQALVMLVVNMTPVLSQDASLYSNIAHALFIAPFFLFSAISGQLADRYDKARISEWVKVLEIFVMCVATVAFFAHMHGHHMFAVWLLFALLFLMGVHSTIFGPVKYAILPQVLSQDELTGGNGLVEMATFLAILLGTLLGTMLIFLQPNGPLWVGLVCIGVAVIGLLTAKQMPRLAPVDPKLKLDWNVFNGTWRSLKDLGENRTVFLSCLGISWFWFFGSLYLAQLPVYVRDVLGASYSVYTLLLSVFAIGTGIGSLLCEVLSKKRIEIGLVPFGSIGMTLFGIDAYFAFPAATGLSEQSLSAFMALNGSWRLLIDLFFMALFSGFFIVPLFALIQTRSEPSKRSRVIAGNNILNAALMVLAAAFAVVVLKAGFSIPELFLFTALLNAVVALYIYSLVPEFFLRFLTWILINTLYRVRVQGEHHLPESGPALLVCNHVSYVDALLIGGSVHRPTRFVMYHKLYNMPLLRFLFKTAKVIPIASSKEDPALLERAMQEIAKALREGELVCVFPEGGLTADGEIARFRPGIERMLADVPVPVIPMALRGLWGSLFSRWSKAMGKVKLPRRFWSRIDLVIAAPMPPTTTAEVLEGVVKELAR